MYFMKITKAVFPVAGLGTRFLPATKANPKEMLPIVDKPLLQYAVEEAIDAGITELIFVTSSAKYSIEDYFDSNYELESRLFQAGKTELLNIIKNILPRDVNCVYIRQNQPKGLGDAVLRASCLIGQEPFAVLLADDLIYSSKQTCLSQMREHFEAKASSIIAVEEIEIHQSRQYGIVALELEQPNNALNPIEAIVEKPKPEQAPSNLAVVGRYIFTPEIFKHLETLQSIENEEIQLTDAIANLMTEQKVYAYQFSGQRFDCGSKLGYLKATVEYGLRHEELGSAFRHYLTSIK